MLKWTFSGIWLIVYSSLYTIQKFPERVEKATEVGRRSVDRGLHGHDGALVNFSRGVQKNLGNYGSQIR